MWNDIKRVDDVKENVAKFVYTKGDAVAESVLYKYPTYAKRTVICCSTQAGCPVGCRFCGAGDNFARSLTTEEITAQVDHCLAQTDTDPTQIERLQIMTMAMGEPLLNLKGLVPALRDWHSKYPRAALLISTSAPRVNYDEVIAISKEIPTVGLQFSVHESTDEARDLLIPFKKKLTLTEMADAGTKWYREVGRRPFFNYCAHDGNSSSEDALRLAKLFVPEIWEATVSVVCERDEGLSARNQHQRDLATDFANKLLGLSYNVRVFDPAGQDTVGGGCGQLWGTMQWMKDHPEMSRPSAGFGLPAVHTPAAQ